MAQNNKQPYYFPTPSYPHQPYYFQPPILPAGPPPTDTTFQQWPTILPEDNGASTANKRPAAESFSAGPSKRVRTTSGPTGETQETDSVLYVSTVEQSSPDASKDRPTHVSKQTATDVWRFVRGLHTRERPDQLPTDEPNLYTKPDTPFVGCKLCSEWKVWKCIVGMTSTIRNHLRAEHAEEYLRICKEENLKYADGQPAKSPPVPNVTPAPQNPPVYTYTQPYSLGYQNATIAPAQGNYGAYQVPTTPTNHGQPATEAASSMSMGEPAKKGTASDVWRFVRGLDSRDKPVDWNPTAEEPILTKKPNTPFLGCKLCVKHWKVWKCMDGMTSTIRIHLQKEHRELYGSICRAENLKQWPPKQLQAGASSVNMQPAAYAGQAPAAFPAPTVPYPYTQAIFPSSPVPHQARYSHAGNAIATDVWYFMRPLESRDKPANWVEPENEPALDRKPIAPFLGCKLCSKRNNWKTWKCINGMSSTIRKHLQTEHEEEYNNVCKTESLKGSQEIRDDAANSIYQGAIDLGLQPQYSSTFPAAAAGLPVQPQMSAASEKGKEPVRSARDKHFSLDGFLEKLVRFILASNQPLDAAESPAFRDLLMFFGNFLIGNDYPDLAKIVKFIEMKLVSERQSLANDMQNALGRVSFTVDLLTESITYLVVTAHYTAKTADDSDVVDIRSRLIAFRHIPDEFYQEGNVYPVTYMAHVFFDIVKSFDILSKVGIITMGDALYDSGVRDELGRFFSEAGVPFDREGNCVRSLPPVIHSAVDAGLRFLTGPEADALRSSVNSEPVAQEYAEYLDALDSDPVSRARNIVLSFSGSPALKDELDAAIAEADLGEAPTAAVDQKKTQLLLDDGRWTSVYLMIEGLHTLYPDIASLLEGNFPNLTLDDAALKVLGDIKEFLRIPYTIHDIVGEEKQPLLAMAVPLYEKLLEFLIAARETMPEISSGISATISCLEIYISKVRSSNIHGLATVINPTTKFKWLDDHWTPQQRDQAKAHMSNAMLEHYRKFRSALQATSGHTMAAGGTPKELSGLSRLTQLSSAKRRSNNASYAQSGRSSAIDPSLDAEPQDAERRELEKDKYAVEHELQRYIADGILEGEELDGFNIRSYWKTKSKTYPIMYRVALDILPVQASVVPSASLLTLDKRNRLNKKGDPLPPELDEKVTILKYLYKPQLLDFTVEWIAKNDQLVI